MRIAFGVAVVLSALAGVAIAKLPPLTPEQQQGAEQKSRWMRRMSRRRKSSSTRRRTASSTITRRPKAQRPRARQKPQARPRQPTCRTNRSKDPAPPRRKVVLISLPKRTRRRPSKAPTRNPFNHRQDLSSSVQLQTVVYRPASASRCAMAGALGCVSHRRLTTRRKHVARRGTKPKEGRLRKPNALIDSTTTFVLVNKPPHLLR